MEKINVVYWSGSGNTAAMAEAIGEGITAAGKEANVVLVSDIKAEELKEAKVFALGCPSMGDENLEEGEMEPFVCDVEEFAQGKIIALFGSYGWGGGVWMNDWVDRMSQAGATVLNGEGIICSNDPDGGVIQQCRSIGEQLAANL